MPFVSSEKNTLGRLLDEKAEKNGDKPFLYFEDQMIRYKEINERAHRIANGFIQRGIKKGDKVGIFMENCPEYIYTWFALSKIGAVEVPINNFHKGEILTYFINYSDAKILVTTERLAPELRKIEHKLENLEHVITHGGTIGSTYENITTEPYQNLLESPKTLPKMDVRFNDLMAIIFTSGTTGASKGVMITHNHAIFVASEYVDCLNYKDMDIAYDYLSLFHMASQFGFPLAALLSDSACVLKTGFSATSFWGDIRKYGCTITGFFEAVLRILSKAPERDDDADNPLCACAVGHVPPEIHKPFERRFAVKLLDNYGMTEADCTIRATLDDIKVGSCGKPRGGYFDVRIFDQNDRELPPHEVGEIVKRPLRPHIMFEGYYKMPEKTLEVFRNLWFHTGDLAYRDEDGYFFFVGREKDMIRRGGENISAQEVESVLDSHPQVSECAAVAAPSDVWGEEVKVVIVQKDGETINPEEIVAYCDARMAYFMVPRYIEFVDTIPRTGASHRPLKDQLKHITPATWDRVKAGVKIKREIEKGR